MNLYEFMAFAGDPKNFEEYQSLLKRKKRQEGTLKRLQEEIYSEEDSLSVFDGELTERDKILVKRHQDRKRELEEKMDKAKARYTATKKRLGELMR